MDRLDGSRRGRARAGGIANLEPEPMSLATRNAETPGDDCSRARELTSARCDGELPDERELERHLADCEPCRVFAGELRTVRREFAELADGSAPDLWPRIASSARTAGRPQPRRPQPRRLQPRRLQPRDMLLRAAAALVGCVGTLALLHAATDEPSNDAAPDDPSSPFAALDARKLEREPLTTSPEHQLLLALAASAEDRR
jgi:hypothetical protein